MPSPWTRLRAALDPLTRRLFGLYLAYPLTDAELVAVAPTDVAHERERLAARGYDPQRLSAAKRHPDTGALHDLSMRYVPDDHPDAATDTALSGYEPEQCQYHVHGFATEAGVDLYSHYELRPDPWPVAGEGLLATYRRLRTHYRPSWGAVYLRGTANIDV